jgi:hypothetical protein
LSTNYFIATIHIFLLLFKINIRSRHEGKPTPLSFHRTMRKNVKFVYKPLIYNIDLLINPLKASILKPNDTNQYRVFSLKYHFSIKTQWTQHLFLVVIWLNHVDWNLIIEWHICTVRMVHTINQIHCQILNKHCI